MSTHDLVGLPPHMQAEYDEQACMNAREEEACMNAREEETYMNACEEEAYMNAREEETYMNAEIDDAHMNAEQIYTINIGQYDEHGNHKALNHTVKNGKGPAQQQKQANAPNTTSTKTAPQKHNEKLQRYHDSNKKDSQLLLQIWHNEGFSHTDALDLAVPQMGTYHTYYKAGIANLNSGRRLWPSPELVNQLTIVLKKNHERMTPTSIKNIKRIIRDGTPKSTGNDTPNEIKQYDARGRVHGSPSSTGSVHAREPSVNSISNRVFPLTRHDAYAYAAKPPHHGYPARRYVGYGSTDIPSRFNPSVPTYKPSYLGGSNRFSDHGSNETPPSPKAPVEDMVPHGAFPSDILSYGAAGGSSGTKARYMDDRYMEARYMDDRYMDDRYMAARHMDRSRYLYD
jgi:hypothetical protein